MDHGIPLMRRYFHGIIHEIYGKTKLHFNHKALMKEWTYIQFLRGHVLSDGWFHFLAVPITIYILSLPLPYIPQGTSLNTYFVVGATVLVVGLIMYNIPQSANQYHKNDWPHFTTGFSITTITVAANQLLHKFLVSDHLEHALNDEFSNKVTEVKGCKEDETILC